MAKWMGRYPRETHAGHQFYRIPARDWREHLRGLGINKTVEGDETAEDDILHPVFPLDPKLEFPSSPPLEDAGIFVKSGIAQHTVWTRSNGNAPPFTFPNFKGFSAIQLALFTEDDWYGECFQVLEAHGWTKCGDLVDSLLAKVIDAEGVDTIEAAKTKYGTEWTSYILELAARHFTEPLSRLWYVANMKSLYYCHYDDLRLGYLWCEYRVKMRYELFALKHIEVTEKNRESGLKGGQADKRRARYDTLNSLALKRMDSMLVASDRERLRTAKAMAREYDAKTDEPLFSNGLKPLSDSWYRDWISHFLVSLRNTK